MDLSRDAWVTKPSPRSSNRRDPLELVSNARGRLELAGGRVRFGTVSGSPGRTSGSFTLWLEEMAGRPGVKDQIEAGNAVLLLDAPIEACRVTFPRFMPGAMQIATGGKTWAFWLVNPDGPSGFDLLDLPIFWFGGRRAIKSWKAALRH